MELNFSKSITESGVPLWAMEMPFSNTVSVGVLIKAGTRDENWPKEAGIAHALEHMFFQGTESFPTSQKLTEYIEEVGGRINANTGKERTFYHVNIPSQYIERGIKILSEQLRKPLFPEEKISVEIKNIIQELRKRKDDQPIFLRTEAYKNIYQNHSLAKDALGIEESLLGFTRNDFVSFKQKTYDPSRSVFIAVGKINSDEVLRLFNKYFPDKVEGEFKREPENMIGQGNKFLVINKDIEQAHLRLNALAGKAKEKESLYLNFFSIMISGGMSFPLFQEVRDKRGLCYSIDGGINEYSDISEFGIYIGTDAKRYKEAIDAIMEVIQKNKNNEKLLEKAKQVLLGRLDFIFEIPKGILDNASYDLAVLDEPRGYEQIIKEIKSVTINNIEAAVDKYLKPEMFYTTMLAPNDFKG